MKKIIALFLTLTLVICVSPASAFADNSAYTPEYVNERKIINQDGEIIAVARVDVPFAEAVKDASFSSVAINYENAASTQAANRSLWWDVYGHRQYSGANDYWCQAVGAAGQYEGDTLLDTHHYTRTFFGTTYNKMGDSGRVWGYGEVWAFGSLVLSFDVLDLIQRVYYGTT